jgi:hypothetical protein
VLDNQVPQILHKVEDETIEHLFLIMKIKVINQEKHFKGPQNFSKAASLLFFLAMYNSRE